MDSRTNEKTSIIVAAKALGVSVKTIQRWVKSGKIQSIKEDNRVFIPVDEIRTKLQDKKANVEDIDQDKKEDVRTIKGQSEDKNPDVIPIERTHYEGLLTRLGQLEAKQELLIEYKAGLEAKDKELSETKSTLAEAEKILTAKNRAMEQAGQRIRELQEQVRRLNLPWYRRIFKR